jgi:hypothetical protein
LDAGSAITTSGNISVTLDLSELTDMTADVSGANDELILLDSGAERRKRIGEIKLSQFNNDSGFTSNTGDITGVTAGNGLTGGGSSGGVTLNVGAGTAIDVAADTVSVDLSELSTSTTNGDGDYFVVVDTANAQRKLTKGNINISGFNNDAGYTTNTGDITAVTAGTNLTGGGTSGSVTLNMATGGIGAGTYGSTANATKIDTITVDAYGRVTAVATGATGDGDITGVTAGTGLSGGGTSGTPTLSIDSTVVTTTGSQTLTNKSIDASQLTGTLPAISGANLTNLPAGGITDVEDADDYEEGTWSPKHATSGGTPNQTYNYNNGYYVKVGNVVTITADVHIASGEGGYWDQRVSNFPFTTKNSTNTTSIGVFGFIQNTGGSSKPMIWEAPENRTYGDVRTNILGNCPAGMFTSNTKFKYTATYLIE